jgi:uncharacterized membrane protein YbhN (UPF0104 family)
LTRTRVVSALVGALLAIVLLAYALRGVDWTEVGRITGRAAAFPLLLTCVIATATLFLRACRWRTLLGAGGDVDVAAAFWATASGYFGNNFLPARAGELIRTFMVSSRSRLDTPFVLATAIAERVADAVALVIVGSVVLLAAPVPPGWLAAAARPIGAIGVAGALTIGVLPRFDVAARALILRLPLPARFRPRLSAAAGRALDGLRSFHDLRRLSAFAAFTAIIWCLDALGAVLAAAALGLTLPLPVAFLLIAGLSVGSALPSTPGYVGIYQFVAVSILTPFGFSRDDAIAYILVVQGVLYAVIGFWGSLGFVRYRRARHLGEAA